MMSNPLPFSLLYILVPLVLLICAGALVYAISALRRLPPTATSYSAVALDPADPPAPPAPIPPPPESWAMKNTDKLLIAGLMALSMIIAMNSKDPGQIQLFNGLTNTFSVCLITLVGGAALRKSTTDTTVTKDPETGRVMGIVTKSEEK